MIHASASTEPAAGPGIAIRLQREFPAARERVFRAWTEAEKLERWWCPPGWVAAGMAIDLRPGGAYRIGMRRSAGGPPVYVTGSFLEVRRPERLVYTWLWENAFGGMPPTRVTVEFIDRGASTRIVLVHERLPEVGVCLRHRSGWLAAWDRLQSQLQ